MAEHVPPVGYKCYTMGPMKVAPLASQASQNKVMENEYYRVVLAPATGAVESIFQGT